MKKALFFDIDGTLIDFDGALPASTVNALNKARKRGHLLYICTGRCKSQLPEALSKIKFDGIVGASGAYVECGSREIYEHCFEYEQASRVIDFLRSNNIIFSCHTKYGVMMDEDSHERFCKYLKHEMGASDEQIAKLSVENAELYNVDDNKDIVEKITYHNSAISLDGVRDMVGDDMTVVPMSIGKDLIDAGEITVNGISKAHGMQKVLGYHGIKREDCIGFGDSANDIEMMQYAGVGVAMGNATKEIKDAADYITYSVKENGIEHALKHFRII